MLLNIVATNGTVTLFWPADAGVGFKLEQCFDLTSGVWSPLTNLPTLNAASFSITLPQTGAEPFFRLALYPIAGGNPAKAAGLAKYPASDHFHGLECSATGNRDYLLIREKGASAPNHAGMTVMDDEYRQQRLTASDAWPAAEIFP